VPGCCAEANAPAGLCAEVTAVGALAVEVDEAVASRARASLLLEVEADASHVFNVAVAQWRGPSRPGDRPKRSRL
jgi:hypothetical protein